MAIIPSPTGGINRVFPICSKNKKNADSKANKIVNFVKKILSSPTFWTTAIGLLGLGLCISAIANPALSTTFLGIGITSLVSSLAVGLLFKKEIKYEISFWNVLYRNKFHSTKWPWYSKIDDNIYLGAMPLKNKGHIDKLTDLAKSEGKKLAILSVLEPWEMQREPLLISPVTPKDWQEKKVEQKTIAATDFVPPTLTQLEEGVRFIQNKVKEGKKVYIHCKAGRGRSATTLACYYMIQNNCPPPKAIEFIEKKRPIVTLYKKPKQIRLQEFFEKISPKQLPWYKKIFLNVVNRLKF